MTYPHICLPGQIDCRCGTFVTCDADLRAGSWGADCPAAMRAEIDRLTQRVAELDRHLLEHHLTVATVVVRSTTGGIDV